MAAIKILDRHLGREISGKSSMVGLWLLVMYLFLSLLDELEGGQHQASEIMQTLAFAVPRMIYELSPMILLIGTILGLTVLSRQQELVAFQVSGISKARIVASVVGYSTVFAFCIFTWGETVVPFSETKRSHVGVVDDVDAAVNRSGVWIRNENDFIVIDRIDKLLNVGEISVYEFSQDGRLEGVLRAESGTIADNENLLTLRNVDEFRLNDQKLEKLITPSKTFQIEFDVSDLVLQRDNPAELNIFELNQLVQLRKDIGLKTEIDELALWNRLIIPLSMLVMGMFAVLFTFKRNVRLSTGHFVMLGLLFGLFYFAVQQSVGYIAILSGFAPIFGMLAVFLVFLGYALMALYRL